MYSLLSLSQAKEKDIAMRHEIPRHKVEKVNHPASLFLALDFFDLLVLLCAS